MLNNKNIFLNLLLLVTLSSPVSLSLATTLSTLTDTGQVTCFDIIGNEIGCPALGQPLYGQDAQYHKQVKAAFKDNGNYTVTDINNGLVWQQYTADTDSNNILNDNDRIHWGQAVDYCENLEFGDYNNWRLPERSELETILDYTRVYPSIAPIFSAYSTYYWSATETASHDYVAWAISFTNSSNFTITKSMSRQLVRCVRGGSNTQYAFIEQDFTVIDSRTHLEWEKVPHSARDKWSEALEYCENLSLADKSDWRLPDIIELSSIVDSSTYSPAIDPIFTSGNSPFWSSTTDIDTPRSTKSMDFTSGRTVNCDKKYGCFTRCVRSNVSYVEETQPPIIPMISRLFFE